MNTTLSLSLTRTRERLSAFAAATMMTLMVMAGITTLAQTSQADGLQAKAQPAAQQVLIVGQRAARS
jgi:hypothetical protein